MSGYATAGIAGEGLGVSRYRRHRPGQTLLYRVVARHYPALVERLADQDKTLPACVRREFEDYLRCGRLEHGFLRVRCESCHTENCARITPAKRGRGNKVRGASESGVPTPCQRRAAMSIRRSA